VDRVFWRLADWSEPSPFAALGRTERILAGEVKPATLGRATVNGKPVTFPKVTFEPEVESIVIGFDTEHNGDIPGQVSLHRGSVANWLAKNVEMVDPKVMMLRKKDKHAFRSDMLVLDIMGGDELPRRKSEEKLRVPGEMLVFNSSGQLEVHSEIEESREYFYNTFPPPDANSGYGSAYGNSDGEEGSNRKSRGRRGGYGY
jgi:hypothetical protein